MLLKPILPIELALALLAAAGLGMSLPARGDAAEQPAEDAGWQLVKETRELLLHRRSVAGSAVPMVRAHTVIEASPRCVYDVVSDYDRFTQFVPYVKRSRVLRAQGSRRWVYQLVSLPGPLSDRHYVIRVTDEVSGEGGVLHIGWEMEKEESLPAAPAVVPAAMSGSWQLRPGGAEGTTEATYAVHLDPGGALPDWLAGLGAAQYLPRVIDAVRERAAHCRGNAAPVVEPVPERRPPERNAR